MKKYFSEQDATKVICALILAGVINVPPLNLEMLLVEAEGLKDGLQTCAAESEVLLTLYRYLIGSAKPDAEGLPTCAECLQSEFE